jgi:uncharacterized metal-binding protein
MYRLPICHDVTVVRILQGVSISLTFNCIGTSSLGSLSRQMDVLLQGKQ